MRRGPVVAALGIGVAAAAVAVYLLGPRPAGLDGSRAAGPPGRADTTAGRIPRVVPESVRVVVEVFNAAGAPGLARLATLHLRDAGFDVVAYGAVAAREARSRVVVRQGDPAWGDSAARVLGGATVEVTPDPSRYVDLSVFLGRGWQPPPGPLRP